MAFVITYGGRAFEHDVRGMAVMGRVAAELDCRDESQDDQQPPLVETEFNPTADEIRKANIEWAIKNGLCTPAGNLAIRLSNSNH